MIKQALFGWYYSIRDYIRFRKKLREMKKRDPYIYK